MQAFRLIGYFLFYFAGVGIYLPFVPLFLASDGLNSVQIGYLLAIGPLTAMSVQVMWGTLADRQNRRKEYLILALAGSALICLLFYLGKGIIGLALLLFLYAFFNSAVTPLADSLVLNVLPDTRQYGKFRRWGSLGFAVAAAGGGVLFSIVPIQYFGTVAGGMFLLTLAWAFCLPNPQKRAVQKAQGRLPIGQVLSIKGMLPFLLTVLLIMVPYNAYISFLGAHLHYLRAPRTWVGLAWTVAALSEIPVFGLGAVCLKKYPAQVLMSISAIVFTLRWLLYAIIPSHKGIVLVQATQSLSYALFYLAAIEYMAKLVPSNLRSSAQGLFQSVAFGLSAVLGAVGGGWFLKHGDFYFLYLIMAITALAGAGGAFFFCRENR